MTIGVWQSILIIAVTALCTILTRVIPFLIFGRKKELPKIVTYLGKVLPSAIIAILVIYCIKGVNFTSFPFGLAEIISIAAVIALHLWKSNTLISIGGGTILYIILVNIVFI